MVGWLMLALGVALWFATHLFKPMAPATRERLAMRLRGEGAAKIAMLLGTLAAVALIVNGYQSVDYVGLWFPPDWTTLLNNLLMVLALGIYLSGGIPGHVRSWIRHPQLVGVKIWALAHLLVNGHLAAAILFGALFAWAVLALIAINRRDGKKPKPEPKGLMPNLIHATVTAGAFIVVTLIHNWAGVWPFAGAPPA
ncbi:MAG: NnrU family protein [Pseudomonadota bacterium]